MSITQSETLCYLQTGWCGIKSQDRRNETKKRKQKKKRFFCTLDASPICFAFSPSTISRVLSSFFRSFDMIYATNMDPRCSTLTYIIAQKATAMVDRLVASARKVQKNQSPGDVMAVWPASNITNGLCFRSKWPHKAVV